MYIYVCLISYILECEYILRSISCIYFLSNEQGPGRLKEHYHFYSLSVFTKLMGGT